MSRIRKGLNISVIRYGNGRHTPLEGSFYQILALGDAVHIAHLSVAVELDPL